MNKSTPIGILVFIAVVAVGAAMFTPQILGLSSASERQKVDVMEWFSLGPVVKAETAPAGSYLHSQTTTITTDTTVVSVYGMPTVTLGTEVFLSRCGRRCKLNGKVEIVVGRRHR